MAAPFMICRQCGTTYAVCEHIESGYMQLEEECMRLRTALGFYANEQNWTSEVDGRPVVLHRIPKHESSMDRDHGAIARLALEEQPQIVCCILVTPDRLETWCGRTPQDGETVLTVPAIDGLRKNCRACVVTMTKLWLRNGHTRKETG